MDVHNVTEEYRGYIDQQMRRLQEAKKQQGKRPLDRKPKEHAYQNFMLSYMSNQAITSAQGGREVIMIHRSVLPLVYRPCTTPMNQLSPIAIRDLQLETHHRGTYLLLRSMTPPNYMTAIMALMEDRNGDAILLQLYQQEDEETRPAGDIITVGTILLVKEPFFKLMADGDCGIRVDHLSDVVHLKEDDVRIPEAWQPRIVEIERSAESLKMHGDSFMKESKYWNAIKEYSDALDQPATVDQIEAIKNNRLLAFLKTKQNEAVLTDTNFPNFTSSASEKALFRTAEALYNLERFVEGCTVLVLLCSRFPQNSQALQLLGRAQSRYLEQTTGEYSFGQLQEEAKKTWPPHLDFATYIGPVEIRQTESTGRGLFVTEAVKAGDLLLCEKAFSCAHVHEGAGGENDKGNSKVSLLVNPATGQGIMGTQADLIKIIVQKLHRNPSVARAFTALHHGDYETANTSMIDGKPVVDTFLVERIISLNGFGCPLSSLASLTDSRDQHPPPSSDTPNGTREKEDFFHSCGIWVLASYINHSCISNARRAFIANMMIVRASKDMEANTEIKFWYRDPHGDSASANKSDEIFKKQWGFTCQCAICLDTRATSETIHHKRQKVREDLKKAFDNAPSPPNRQVTRQFERLLTNLNETYTQPPLNVPRLLVWEPQLALTSLYAAQKNPQKTLDSAAKVLTSLSFVLSGANISSSSSSARFAIAKWGLLLDSGVMETFLHIRAAFAALGAHENAKAAEGYARTVFKVLVGEDSSFRY